MDIRKEIIDRLLEEEAATEKSLERIKKEVAKKYKAFLPTNVDLLQFYHKTSKKNEKVLALLKTRPVRSLSGVVNISVLTKPYPCPGKCIYCPEQKGTPKSYLRDEPAVMRALINKYDPAKQVAMRISSLQRTGHPTGKIELRIVGGTWSSYSDRYKSWFVKRCFDACNKKRSRTLEEAHRKNEQAEHRIVCLSVETRPDLIDKREVEKLRTYGVTMVELGVQSLSDKVLALVQRGHGVRETITATKLLKDAGFKICYQMMLDLPGSSPEEDINTFRKLFENPSFRPDFLKIYPCLVIEDTPLYNLLQQKQYQPTTDKKLTDIIVEIKKEIIPYYVRIQRLFRDISLHSIKAGCKTSNLREKIAESKKKNNWKCKCIRCREVRERYDPKEKKILFKEEYDSAEGKEIFLSVENENREKLFALLRLRITPPNLSPVFKNSAVVREIRTYGQHLLIGSKKSSSPQHTGLGKKLIKKAEKIAKKDFRREHMVVISGVGARKYWRSLGYELEKTYMIKRLEQ